MSQAQQPKNLEEALQVIQQQNELINQLKVALQLQQHRQFAKKNESLNPDQLSLFEEKQVGVTDSEEPSDAAVEKRESSRHPKPKKNNSRKENLDRLPQEGCEYDLDDKTCPDCHQEMKQIGRRLASREAVYVPAHTVCRNVYAKTYKCQHCHPNGGDKLVTAKTLFNHSYISSSILATIAANKFDLAVPFNRQERMWQAANLELDSKQMANTVIKGAKRFLKPLSDFLVSQLRQEKVVHMDETPFQVLDSGKSKSYFWALRTPKEFAKHQIAYFYYAPTRSGKVIIDILTPDYTGAVMCDGYRGYGQEQLPKATFGSCLIHIRRPFIELVKGLTLKNNVQATQAVKLLSRVFHEENNLRYKTPAEKKTQRRKLVKPLLDAFYRFIEGIAYPMHKLKDAVKNALKLKDRVYQIFKIGELPLSNNSVEQSIRPSTIIRKKQPVCEIYSRCGSQCDLLYDRSDG